MTTGFSLFNLDVKFTFSTPCPDALSVGLVMMIQPGQYDPLSHAINVGTQGVLVYAG